MFRAKEIIESTVSLFRLDERTVLNIDEVGRFVDSWKRQTDDSEIQKWFASNFRRWLINTITLASVVPPEQIPPTAPDWIHQAVEKGEKVYIIDFKYLKEESIQSIIDWFESDDRPNDLSRIDPQTALDSAAKWAKMKERQEREVRDPVENVKEIFKDGDMTWVQIITPEGLDREGEEMHHCLGKYYFNQGTFFSLRDSKNKPHFTIFINNSDELEQAKGYNNGAIEANYKDSLMKFLNDHSDMQGVTKQGRGDLDMNELHWDEDTEKVADGQDGSYWKKRLLEAVKTGNEYELRKALDEVMEIYDDAYYEVLDELKIDDCWIVAYAARKHDWVIVDVLINYASMDLRAADPKNGFTPLFYAAEDEDFTVFQWILKEVHDYNGESEYLAEDTNNRGETILEYVCRLDLGLEWIQELLKYDSSLSGIVTSKGQNLLHLACVADDLSLINGLTSHPRHDIDINRKDHDGNTPIVYLVDHNNVHTMEMLVKRGADIHSIGKVLLKRAKKQGRPEITKWLNAQGITESLEDKKMVRSRDILKRIGEIYGSREQSFWRTRRGDHSVEGSYGGKTVGPNLSHDLGDVDSIWTVWKNLQDDLFLEYLMKTLAVNVRHGKNFKLVSGKTLAVRADIDDQDAVGEISLEFDRKKGSLEISYSINYAAGWDSGDRTSPPEPRSTLDYTDSALVWSSENLEDVVGDIIDDMVGEASKEAQNMFDYDPYD
jgi:hypothetical protein